MTQVFDDVACPACGCVCDDLRLTVVDNRVTEATGGCSQSQSWFLEQNKTSPPLAEVDGRKTTLDAALSRAAKILRSARWPLVCGLTGSSTPDQRAAIRLAERVRATIDPTCTPAQRATTLALQEVGMSTCTLGEVRHRADLVIFWGCDPAATHPRLLERFIEAAGEFVPRGRAGRTVIVIDSSRNQTAAVADQLIALETQHGFEALWTLRCLLRGVEPAAGSASGAPLAVLQQLAEQMKGCRSGVVFYGPGLTAGAEGHRNVEALLRLVRELNAHTRFYARGLRTELAGAENVLAWQTGYPLAVNFARGFPRYSPGEYSAGDLLARREVDACLIVGSDVVPEFSAAAQAHFQRIPTIVLDGPGADSTLKPTVRIRTAVYGVHLAGTAYRLDDVPIPLRPVLTTEYPSDDDVLNQLCDRIAGTG